MKIYIAFLRGINISGKNKVPMAELKKAFEELRFGAVKTYLNSGNVIFSSDEDNIGSLTSRIEAMIKERFSLDIPVFVISKEDLEDILQHAPDWWGNENKEILLCLLLHLPNYGGRSESPGRAWKRLRIIRKRYSGLSAGRIIKKQTGGQRPQA